MNILKKAIFLGAGVSLLALTGLFSSCTYGSEGIFYSLEHATKITSGNGFGSNSKYVSTNSMAEYFVGTTDYYLETGGGALFYTQVGTDSWQTVSALPDSRVGAIGGFAPSNSSNTSIMYAIAGDDSDNNALYATISTSADFRVSSSWQKVNVSGDPMNLVPVLANDVHTVVAYLLVTQTDSSSGNFANVYLITPSAATPTIIGSYSLVANLAPGFTSLLTSVGAPLAASIDGTALANSNLYVMNPSFVWAASLNGSGVPSSFYFVTGLPGGPFSAVAYVASGTAGLGSGLLLGDNSGNLTLGSVSNPGTSTASWTQTNSVSSSETVNGTKMWFTTIGLQKTTGALLVGTAKTGFGQIFNGGFTAPPDSNTVDTSSWTSSLLQQNGVQMFFSGSNGTDFFIGTFGFGLWTQASDKTFSLE